MRPCASAYRAPLPKNTYFGDMRFVSPLNGGALDLGAMNYPILTHGTQTSHPLTHQSDFTPVSELVGSLRMAYW